MLLHMIDHMMENDDKSLMRAVVAGDLNAFVSLMDRYVELVSRTSFRILCDRGDSEKIASDLFIRVWKEAGKYDMSRPLIEWILGMTCRMCRMELFRRRLSSLFSSHPEVYVTSPPTGVPQDDYMIKQVWEIYCRASRKMSSSQRVVFVLSELEGLSGQEVHFITGMSSYSIRYALVRARELIKTDSYRSYVSLLRNIDSELTDRDKVEQSVLRKLVKPN